MFFTRAQRTPKKYARELNLIQVFKDSIERQIKENKDFKTKLNLLGDSTAKTADVISKNTSAVSKALKNTTAAVTDQGKKVMKTMDPIISPIARTATKTGEAIVSGIEQTYKTVDTIAAPLKTTEAYKAYKETKKSIIETALEVQPKGERVSNFKAVKSMRADEKSTALEAVKQSRWSRFKQPGWFNMAETEQAKITRYK